MRAREVRVIGVAVGRGAGVAGAEDGPAALRRLGLVEALSACGHRVEDLGDVPGAPAADCAASPEINRLPHVLQVSRHTHDCVRGALGAAPDAFLLAVGGDHSLAIGLLAGVADACERLGVVWIDAHGDYNTPASSPSGNAHGMSLAVACGQGAVELRSLARRDPLILEQDVALLGVRDIDAAEQTGLARSGVTLLAMDDWRRQGVVDAAVDVAQRLARRCDHVHLSFDIDALDARHVPGTGTPVAGGLSLTEARRLFDAFSNADCFDSAEFVEYNPRLDRTQQTGCLTIELIKRLMSVSGATPS